MSKKIFVRKTHRWLGIVAAIQLFIWMASGLFFSVIPIENVRGTHLIEPPAAFRLAYVKLVSPSALVRQYPELAMVSLDDIRITQRLNIPVYIVEMSKPETQWLVFNAETAEKLALITEADARLIAINSTGLALRSVSWVSAIEPGSEYREGELPAWKVELDGAGQTNLWIGANTGQVRAVRTTTWRIYDFLWSLHIMDYQGRDNFNSWLLRGFALLGLITILSGILLFVFSIKRKKSSQSKS